MNIQIDKSDELFSIWIRLRDRRCVKCGSPVQFNSDGRPISHQNSHFKSRRCEPTRHDPDNCDTLCGGCHQMFTKFPLKHEAWQRVRKGDDMVDHLILKSNGYKKKDRVSEAKYWRERIKKDFPSVKGY